jgi:hypothetical protein
MDGQAMNGPSGYAAIPAHLFGVLDPYEIAVFAVLAIHQNEDHECWPSHARIADLAGMSERKVRDVLADLRDKGIIEWQARGREDGSKSSNLYRLIGMVPGTVRPTPRHGVPHPPAPRAGEPTQVTNPGKNEAVPTGPGDAHPLLPLPPIGADEAPVPVALRRGPATRDAATLIGVWARGHKAANGKEPIAGHRTRFAKVAQQYAARNDLGAFPPEQWLRLVDTAYVLGAGCEFALLDAFHGGGGKPPRMPVSCRYRIGSRGGVSAAPRMNIDQPAATWEQQ